MTSIEEIWLVHVKKDEIKRTKSNDSATSSPVQQLYQHLHRTLDSWT